MVRTLAADGWCCHIVLPAASPMADEYVAAGATLHVVPMRKLTTSGPASRWLSYLVAWPVSVWRLARLSRRLRVDVIHTNSLHSLYGWAVAAVLRKPHVWHVREIVYQSRAALRLERVLARHAAQVITPSEAVASQLDPANICVIADEPDTNRFQPGRAGVFRSRLGIADQAPLVGAVGRLDTWKGFDVFLDAVPAIQAARPGAEVLVAGAPVPGKEQYASALAAQAQALGVRWLGPRTDVDDLIADLDLLVLPSTQPEPFAGVLTEALASGVPVVATDSGGSPEILRRAGPGAGRLIPPRDAAALAAAAVALLPEGPSSAGRRRARRPRWRAQVPGFAPLFDSLLDSGR